MALPNFVVIGAQKCGTTWLHANLSRHADVYMPPAPHKELRYFCSNYDRGRQWYAEFFRDAASAAAIGEATPNYTASRDSAVVASRMHETLPDAKLIYIVRHPVERLRSGYSQLQASGVPLPSFRRALMSYPSILATSRYWDRLNDFLALYPARQIHCVFLEDIKREPRQELARCLEFLEVDAALPEGFPGGAVNRRKDLRGDRWRIVKSVRNSRAYRSVQSAVPRSVVRALKPVYQRKLASDTTWDAETLDWARDALYDDAQRFLEHCGKPSDFWDFSLSSAVSSQSVPGKTAAQRP